MPGEGDDLLELGQITQDFEIDLDGIGNIATIVDVTNAKDFSYPAIVLSGVSFRDTLRVLEGIAKDSYRSTDVWLDMEDGAIPSRIGTLPLTMDTLIVLRYLGVQVTLYLAEDSVEVLDLTDPDVLERFI